MESFSEQFTASLFHNPHLYTHAWHMSSSSPSLNPIVWQRSPSCHQTLWLQFSPSSPRFIKVMCNVGKKTANKRYSLTTRVHSNLWKNACFWKLSSLKIKGESPKCQDDGWLLNKVKFSSKLYEARAVMSFMLPLFFLPSSKGKKIVGSNIESSCQTRVWHCGCAIAKS